MRRIIRSENQRAAWKAVHIGNDKPNAEDKRLIRRRFRRVSEAGLREVVGEVPPDGAIAEISASLERRRRRHMPVL